MMESNRGANAASPDKVVIVSSFTSTLSLVESLMLKPAGYTYLRLDGTTSMEDRQARVNAFNKQPRLFCFLLSSKAGGWYVRGADNRGLSGFCNARFNLTFAFALAIFPTAASI
jgi:hypothetical protein